MGDMLNIGCWQWVSMEYHPYEFLEGHICVVVYCNVELAVCILFVVWDLYSYPGSVTASFPSSGSGSSLLYDSHHCQSSLPICWSILSYPLPRYRNTPSWQRQSTSLKPSMWLRYVGDTFILWPHQEDVQILIYHVNSIPPSIQFPMEKKQDNKLPFLGVLVTRTEQGFRSSVYRKPTFTGQYLNFNSHHPYKVKKGIVRYLQHRAKTISSDAAAAYQEEMISLRHHLHRNNYPESIIPVPKNLDRRMGDNTRKLTTVSLSYVKGLAERIQKICSPYDIRTVFTSGSTLRRYLFRVKPPTEFNMTKNCLLHPLQLW